MMQPTMKLRWVRTGIVQHSGVPHIDCLGEQFVLQQWFESSYDEEDGYWIDIPIEIEE